MARRDDPTSALLTEAGKALYGPRWQSELARALGISDRTMRRWIAEPDNVPPGVYDDLLPLLHDKAASIAAIIKTIARTKTPP